MYRQLNSTIIKNTLADIAKNIGYDLFFVTSLFFLSQLTTMTTNIDIKTTFSYTLILGMFFRLFQR